MHLTAMGKKLCPGLFTLREIRCRLLPLIIPLLIFFLSLSTHSYSQGITLSLNNVAITTAFKEIQKQSPYRFVYTNEELAATRNINITVDNAPLSKVLELCFKDQPLNYTIEDKFIMIKAREKKTEPPMKVDNEIRGKVTNEKGEGIAGATVTIKGTQKAAPTDNNGEFILADATTGSVIVITTIGYETQEFIVGKNRYLTVRLQVAVSSLDEMVLKGYYSTTKRLNTGSVSKITADDIAKQPVSNPITALSGRVPGLYVRQFSGVPGRTVSMTLRGQNSLRSDGNDPLIIVDGIPFPSATLSSFFGTATGANVSPFDNIAPSDIESIEILKDADATAIYGSRGANGVILITTKKGKPGNTKVDFNLYTGLGKVSRMMDLLNTQQYLEMRREAFKNDGVSPGAADYDVNGTWDTTRYTDWQKVLIGGTARITNLQASISGGNANTQFLIGGGYLKQTTVFPGDWGEKKASVHFNIINTSGNQRFKTVLSGTFLSNINNLPQQNLTSLINLAPDAPAIYDAGGSLNWQNETWKNPYAYLLQKHTSKAENLSGNIEVSYIIVPGLQLKATAGINNINFGETILTPIRYYAPSQVNSQQNTTNFVTNDIKTWIIEPQINYRKPLWKGTIDMLVGTTFQETLQDNLAQTGTGFTSEFLMENLAAASSITINGTNYSQYRYNAIFGRFNYNVDDKYILNLTGRRDGSSRFGPGKQFANFWATGISWIFSKESFFPKRLKPLSFGKLRASYGTTGSDKISDYGYLNTYNSTGIVYQGVSGLAPARLYNSDYAWELNKKMEVGIELGFFNDRLLFNANYYYNRSSNQLVGYPLPATTGFTSVQFNLPATVQNTGGEFELNTINIRSIDFTWSTSVNLTIPRNKLISFPNLEGSSYLSQYIVDKSLFILKSYHFTGVNPQTGLYTFEDVDKDGSVSYPNDLQGWKEKSQRYFGGFRNLVRYKRWEMEFLLQFVKQLGENYLSAFRASAGAFSSSTSSGNQPSFILNRWQKLGDVSSIQQFSQATGTAYAAALTNAYSSDNSISDASYIRLKNISIAFRLNEKWVKKLHLQNFKIYMQGQNLFTVTRFKGLDPESQGSPMLPPLKMFTVGLQVSF